MSGRQDWGSASLRLKRKHQLANGNSIEDVPLRALEGPMLVCTSLRILLFKEWITRMGAPLAGSRASARCGATIVPVRSSKDSSGMCTFRTVNKRA
jgi:hypothetical protein